MRRPSTARSRRLAITGVFTGAVLVSLVVPALLPLDVAGWIVIGTAVGGLFVISRLVWTNEILAQATLRYKACAITAAMASILLQILLLVAVPEWTLRVRGESMSATVTAERIGKSIRRREPDTHNYTLTTPSGHLLSQELVQDEDDFSPGDRVTVVVDRRDLINPQLAEEMEDIDDVLLLAPAVLFGLMLLMCFVAGGMSPDGAGRDPSAGTP